MSFLPRPVFQRIEPMGLSKPKCFWMAGGHEAHHRLAVWRFWSRGGQIRSPKWVSRQSDSHEFHLVWMVDSETGVCSGTLCLGRSEWLWFYRNRSLIFRWLCSKLPSGEYFTERDLQCPSWILKYHLRRGQQKRSELSALSQTPEIENNLLNIENREDVYNLQSQVIFDEL